MKDMEAGKEDAEYLQLCPVDLYVGNKYSNVAECIMRGERCMHGPSGVS